MTPSSAKAFLPLVERYVRLRSGDLVAHPSGQRRHFLRSNRGGRPDGQGVLTMASGSTPTRSLGRSRLPPVHGVGATLRPQPSNDLFSRRAPRQGEPVTLEALACLP